MLRALGELGVANSEVPGGDHALPRPERPVVSNAAAEALLQLTGQPCWGDADWLAIASSPQLRCAVQPLGHWLPVAGCPQHWARSAQTLAENSPQLIALRGLGRSRSQPGSAEAVLTAMTTCY